jgi:hypothetical protein
MFRRWEPVNAVRKQWHNHRAGTHQAPDVG